MATRDITSADYALVVHTIRVTVHTTGKFFEGDTRSGNHASIYLLTADGTSSVRLNMIKARSTDTRGTYQLSYCNYRDTNSSVHDFDIQAVQGLTVHHVLSLISERGRDKYKLARSGVGCRFWVQTVIKDLDSRRFIASSSAIDAAAVVDGLRYNYSRSKSPEFEEVEPGAFI